MRGGPLLALLGCELPALEAKGQAIRVVADLRWGEGPAYVAHRDQWIFSDIPNDRVLAFSEKGSVSVFRQPSNFSNGHHVTRSGMLLSCEHLTRCVSSTDLEGERVVLCARYDGRRLNSPNDIVEAHDGSIWFTDPTYGILSDVEGRRAVSEQERNRVYRYDPISTAISAEIEELSMPNGLCFSPVGQWLYVADSGAEMGPDIEFDPSRPRDVYQFAIGSDGRVSGRSRHFCRIATGVPDGMRCDEDGNLWVATGAGVEAYSPDATYLGRIATPDTASNLAFGGQGDDRVMITTESSAWLIKL